MKKILIALFLFPPLLLLAQYPTGTNKSRLGYQTTGDGLIWRGVAADTAIKPRTTANAYFQLDTVNRVLRRYIATQGSWQVVGGTSGGITPADTSAMLAKYIERGDTAAMLSNYTTFGDISTALGDYFPLQGGTLTGTGGVGFIGFPSQVSAPGTPASGLNVYAQGSSFNWKGTDGYERQFASTLTGGRTYTLPNVNGTFALGTGTATRVPIWTSTNTLGDSPILYNPTTKRTTWDSPGVIELPMGTDAQRPIPATTSDFWYGQTGLEVYNGTRWAKVPEFTFNTGAAGRIPFPDANGQYTESANLTWDNTNFGLQLISNSTAADRGLKVRQTNNGVQAAAIKFQKNRNGSAVQNGDLVGVFTLEGYSGSQYIVDNALFGGVVTGTVTSSSVPTSIFFNAGSTIGNYNTQLLLHSGGNVGIGNHGSILGGITAPSDKLHVKDGGILVEPGTTNIERFVYINTNANGTNSRTGFAAQTGSSGVSTNTRLLVTQAFPPSYTDAAYGGSFVAGNYFIGGINYNAGATVNQRLHFALGSIVTAQTDTVEYVFNRFSGSNTALSNTTRFAALANRGFQLPATITSNRPFTKAGQYWIKGNTDSSMLEMKLPAGWEMIASRAYARSLVAALTPDTWLGSRLATGDAQTYKSGTASYLNMSNSGIRLKGANGRTTITLLSASNLGYVIAHNTGANGNIGGAYVLIDTTGAKDLEYYMIQDNSTSILQNIGTGPQIVNYWLHPALPSGSGYTYSARLDTSISVSNPIFRLSYGDVRGSRNTVHYFRSAIPDYETSQAGWQAFTSGLNGKLAFTVNGNINLRQGGKVYFAIDSTFSFDPSTDLLQLSQYGTGTKEAADISKTESVYSAWYATDGTVIEKRANTEQYYTITSTSSPQTLSSTISDNLINQGSTQATFTLTFPASPVDGQVLKITYNNAITTLTLDGNGNTIVGSAVTTGVAGSQRAFKFYTGIGWIKLY